MIIELLKDEGGLMPSPLYPDEENREASCLPPLFKGMELEVEGKPDKWEVVTWKFRHDMNRPDMGKLSIVVKEPESPFEGMSVTDRRAIADSILETGQRIVEQANKEKRLIADTA